MICISGRANPYFEAFASVEILFAERHFSGGRTLISRKLMVTAALGCSKLWWLLLLLAAVGAAPASSRANSFGSDTMDCTRLPSAPSPQLEHEVAAPAATFGAFTLRAKTRGVEKVRNRHFSGCRTPPLKSVLWGGVTAEKNSPGPPPLHGKVGYPLRRGAAFAPPLQ